MEENQSPSRDSVHTRRYDVNSTVVADVRDPPVNESTILVDQVSVDEHPEKTLESSSVTVSGEETLKLPGAVQYQQQLPQQFQNNFLHKSGSAGAVAFESAQYPNGHLMYSGLAMNGTASGNSSDLFANVTDDVKLNARANNFVFPATSDLPRQGTTDTTAAPVAKPGDLYGSPNELEPHLRKDTPELTEQPENTPSSPVLTRTLETRSMSLPDNMCDLDSSDRYETSQDPDTKVLWRGEELGLVDDLLNIGLPWDHVDRVRARENYADIPTVSKEKAAGDEDGDVAEQSSLVEADQIDYIDKGYTSDITDLARNDTDSEYTINRPYERSVEVVVEGPDCGVGRVPYVGEPVTDLRNDLQHLVLEDQIITINLHRDASIQDVTNEDKSQRKKKKKKGRRVLEGKENDNYRHDDVFDPSQPSSSRAISTPDSQGGRQSSSSGRSSAGGRDSKSGAKSRSKTSARLLRPNSIPGVFSDDEYADISTTSVYRTGRRSAPVFSRRGFSGSEFFNSGQTALTRTHIQDVYAHVHGVARPSRRSLFSKFAGKRDDQIPQQQQPRQLTHDWRDRSQSLGGGSSRRGIERIREENEQASPEGHRRRKSHPKQYGSMAATNAMAAGYCSENDEGRRKLQNNASHSAGRRQVSINEPPQTNRRFRSRTDNDALISIEPNNVDAENPLQGPAEDVRSRGMKGVFRTPRSVTPRDLRVARGRDALTDTKLMHDYVSGRPTAGSETTHSVMPTDTAKGADGGGGEDNDDESDEDEDDDDDEEDEMEKVTGSQEKLDRSDVQTEVFKRRWYLLFLFSLSSLIWNAVWSTWGPIAQSAKKVFNWDDGNIAMFTWLGNVPFLVTMFPIAYLMDVKGMRVAMIFSCGLMFIGAGFRCIPSDAETATWLIYTGQLLNGIAGTVPCSGPALLSGLWFPPNQRATATAIATIAGYLGACFSFVVGPWLVPEPNDISPINSSYPSLSGFYAGGNSSNSTDSQKQEIMNMLYFECGLAALVLILVLIYFPSKPPVPPSISASIPREKYLNGLKMLVRNKQFWITAVAYSVPIGVYEVWQVVLDVNLYPKVSQQTAGWLDFYATIGGCVSGLLVSRFADFFTRQMKLFLLVFYFLAALSILWFTLVVVNILPFDTVSIYAAIIIGGIFLDGGAPLFFELVIEVSYPVGEGVTSGSLQMICAAAGVVFLSLVQIESIGKQWMNWCFFGCVTMAIPLLFFINTNYGRADIDDLEIEISSSSSSSSSSSDDDEEDAINADVDNTISEKTSLLQGVHS